MVAKDEIRPWELDYCPVLKLPIIRKAEWTDITFNNDYYRLTIIIIGNNIILTKIWGYSTYFISQNYFALIETIINEYFPSNNLYVHIEDYTDHTGASVKAKNYYTNYQINNKRLKGIIFYGASAYFKVMIKLGIRIGRPPFEVKIANDYPSAITIVKQILSGRERQFLNQKLTEKHTKNKYSNIPVQQFTTEKDITEIQPGHEKSAKDTGTPGIQHTRQILKKEVGFCPVTGQSISTYPLWTDINLDEGYSVTFRLIGDRILLSIPCGNSGKYGMKKLIETREKFLKSIGLFGKKYIEIKDYSKVTGKTTKEGRLQFVDLMIKERDKGNLLGFWGFNASLFVKLAFNIGTKLYRTTFPMKILDNYKTVINMACQVLDYSGITNKTTDIQQFSKKDWKFEYEDYTIKFMLIGDDIIYTIATGILREDYVNKFFELHKKVLDESGLTDKGYYYRIINWEKFEKPTWVARKVYIEGLKKLNSEVPCKYSVLFGLNKLMKVVINISKNFSPVTIGLVNNFEEALNRIDRIKSEKNITKDIKKTTKEPAKSQPERIIINKINNLLEFIGEINWDKEGVDYENRFDDSHLFKPLYEAISLVKQDFDFILQEKNKAEEELTRQNKYNKLRADIWKLATDKSYTEYELIQKLLNEVGPVIGVSRACFNSFTGKNPLTSDLINVLEWCDTGVKPTIGKKVPNILVKHFITKDFFILTAESALKMIPKPFRAATGPIIYALRKSQDLEIISVMPYYINNKLRGWFSFDVCSNKKGKTSMTEDIKNIIYEVVKIVSQHTEQKITENAIRENKERLSILFEYAPDAYYIIDLKGVFIDGNKAAEKLLGYNKDELIGKSFLKLKLLPLTQIPKATALLSKNLIGKGTGPDEFLLNQKSGSTVPVEITTYPIKIKDKSVVLGIARDVTERKKVQDDLEKAYEGMESKVRERTFELVQINKQLNKEISERKKTEKFLRKSESSLTKAQKIACLGSWEYNVKKNTLIWSDQMYQIFGQLKDFDVNVESLISLIHPDDKEYFKKTFETSLSQKKAFEIQYRVIRQDKLIRFVQTQAEHVFNKNEELIQVHGITHDITEIKIAENELEKSNQKFLFFFNETPLAYIEWNTELEVIDWNPSSEKIFGYSKKEVMGVSIIDKIIPENLQTQVIEIWTKLMKQNTGQIFTNVNLTKDNRRIICNWFNTPLLDKNKQIIGMASLIQDITDLKVAEEELKHARITAEEANYAKSEFLANMSHEIRTPMNSILGFSEILSNLINDPVQKDYLNSIRSSSEILLSLINNILDLSKIEAGKLEIKKAPVNIRLIITEFESIFVMKLKEKQLDFVKEIDPDVPMFLNLDELRIRQVLLNLISNAVKYTDSGYVKINVKVNKKYDNKIDLSLSVIDTGIGISEKNQKIIFDSFQQVEEQETRKFGGTGLGLSISKRLVELMGGEIVVKSELNKGSVFTILIKEVSITEQDIEQKDKYELKPERIEFEHSRILIVDDIENNRKVIKVFLQDYDLDILEAENGQQALYILKEIKPDLVFMDIKMPGLDGYQVIKIIRKEKTLKDIPVIAITALAFKKVDKDIIDMGFDGYLIKPVQQVEILNELTKFIKYKEVVIKKETKQTRDIILSEFDFEKLPAIIEKIEENIMPVWISISKRQTIQKTKQFYEKLKELDELFFFKPISYYCDNLSNAINTFNIDNINRLVLEFPYLISKFKNIINENK